MLRKSALPIIALLPLLASCGAGGEGADTDTTPIIVMTREEPLDSAELARIAQLAVTDSLQEVAARARRDSTELARKESLTSKPESASAEKKQKADDRPKASAAPSESASPAAEAPPTESTPAASEPSTPSAPTAPPAEP